MNKTKYIYGYHSIVGLIKHNPQLIKSLHLDSKRQDKRAIELVAYAKEHNLDIIYCDHVELNKLVGADAVHQGFVATIGQEPKALSLDDLCKVLDTEPNAIVLMLDGITDPHNLGAIIRTAECFGVKAIILPKNNSANTSSIIVSKTSSGAVYYIPIIMVNNLAQTIDRLKKIDFWVAATVLAEDSISLFDFKPHPKMIWILGNESLGVRRLVRESSDYLITIPNYGVTQSLNVSVAAGVILSYNIRYQQ